MKTNEEELVYQPDYAPNPDKDTDDIYALKVAVDKLDSVSKLVFLTYCELGSYAALSRYYKVSKPTARKYIQRIRDKLYDNL